MHAERIADYETVVRLDMDQLSVTPGALPSVLRLGIWDALDAAFLTVIWRQKMGFFCTTNLESLVFCARLSNWARLRGRVLFRIA